MRLHEIVSLAPHRSQPLVESVSGNIAEAYHRTRDDETLAEIGRVGALRSGEDGLYGAGIYLTYDLDSQFTDYMRRYGDLLIKCRVDLSGFLILDHLVAREVYGGEYSLAAQIKSNSFASRVSDTILAIWQHGLENKRGHFSSNTAHTICEKGLITGLKGIAFTGENDGCVIVAFHPSNVRPEAWCEAPVGDGMPAASAWTSFSR